ncbi:IclR family transcriptional regulator [Psychrobacter aquaticus]|uniref:Transcriptional regulator, IclR family n=1 Tax=Psychrobacter aquaticus CMS 56 TaxID=1354303 RepID=U4T7R5_9GAMM|nr:IclR family transcriptional regulator [Psychrobacter aquaticus]ERL56166.1 Transcriptional regulator, IclR family [Psychrobacter aquaticus CMS 56]
MANATKRALKVIKAMRSATFSGISVTELAKTIDTSAANICRDLDDLVSEGMAEKRDDGRYQLSVAMLQIATAYQTDYNRMSSRLAEINNRIQNS